MLEYLLYMQIEYPVILSKYYHVLQIIDDSDYLPEIVPENKYYTATPEGFKKQEVDGLLLRNASFYLLTCIILLTIYLSLKIFKTIMISYNMFRKYNKIRNIILLILDKSIEKFEFSILLGGISASYLNFTVYSFL